MTVRNIKKSLAGVEDIATGIGTLQQERGIVHRVNVFPSSYSYIDMQQYEGGDFFRLYGSDLSYTDYRRNPAGTVGIPAGAGGVWEPLTNNDKIIGGNTIYGAYLADDTYLVWHAATSSNYAWAGAFPKTVAPGTDPSAVGSGYTPRTDVALRDEVTNSGEFSAEEAGYRLSSLSRCLSEFGVLGNGLSDDTTGIQAAIDWAGNGQGRRIYGRNGDQYRITAGLVLRFDNKELDEASSAILDFSGTTIIPDADNITCLKVSRNYVVVVRPKVDNKNSRSSITAYALAPEDETQTTMKVWQMYCEFHAPVARGCSVGFRFRPGPTVAGSNSGSFYHDIYSPRFHNCGIGFHLARSVSGDNLTTRVNVFAPKHVWGHCAWDIEAADSLVVFGGSAEFINQSGTHSGNPTIKIHKPVAGDALSTSNICFHRYYGEYGTTPFDISMLTEQVSITGCTFFGYTNNGVNNGTYALQNMFQNEGAIVSRAKYSPDSTAMLAVRREVGENIGQAYLRYKNTTSYPAEFYADRGFTFAATIDKCPASDLRQTHLATQYFGSFTSTWDAYGYNDHAVLRQRTPVLNGGWYFETAADVSTAADNMATLGTADRRWKQLYAVTGTINTSDAREKTAPNPISDDVLDAWGEVSHVAFKWLDAVAKKGDMARTHFGVIAQDVRDAFARHGLDGTKFGLLCHDTWDAEYEPILEEREVPEVVYDPDAPDGSRTITVTKEVPTGEVKLVKAAGDRWGIRVDQCLFLEAAYQRRNYQRMLARIEALEAK